MPILKSLDNLFFYGWSEPMAYVLGYFAADGCMLKNKRGACFIEFTSTDKELLQIVQYEMASSHTIATRIKNENWKTQYRLQIGSKIIFESLLKIGFTPNKSLTLAFPKVPQKYLHHFVRGYFDGDGHVSVGEYYKKGRSKISRLIFSGFTSGSQEFLKALHGKLKKYAGIQGGTLYQGVRAYRLHFSINDSKRLYEFMYQNSNGLHLTRKKLKFESY